MSSMRQHRRAKSRQIERHPVANNPFMRAGRYWGCVRLMECYIGRYEGFRFISTPCA